MRCLTVFKLNLKQVEQTKITLDRELLPEGTYAARITQCECHVSKAGHPFFSFEFTIDALSGFLDCPFAGRKIWNNLMIAHPNETVVLISQKTMADILVASGVEEDADITDLERDFPLLVIDKPFYITTYHKMDKVKKEWRTEISAYFGRGEHEGKHRYIGVVKVPTLEDTISGSEAVCTKAKALRDAKIAKDTHKTSPYSEHPMADIQKAKTQVALYPEDEDVPY